MLFAIIANIRFRLRENYYIQNLTHSIYPSKIFPDLNEDSSKISTQAGPCTYLVSLKFFFLLFYFVSLFCALNYPQHESQFPYNLNIQQNAQKFLTTAKKLQVWMSLIAFRLHV